MIGKLKRCVRIGERMCYDCHQKGVKEGVQGSERNVSLAYATKGCVIGR